MENQKPLVEPSSRSRDFTRDMFLFPTGLGLLVARTMSFSVLSSLSNLVSTENEQVVVKGVFFPFDL